MTKNRIFIWCTLLLLLPLAAQAQHNDERPYVVVISMDGFRWDYPDKYALPHFDSIQAKGVKAERVQSSFPTLTFPNHYTMATGLYPDKHGVVHNKFYAADVAAEFKSGSEEAIAGTAFWGGEPIWVTANKQGIKTAAFYWVGSETPVQGLQPDSWKPYEHHFPFAQRIDTVMHWLTLPEDIRPHLIMLYFHEPDEVSHRYGAGSAQTQAVVQQLDSLLGDFMHKLQQLPIAGSVNVIVTSDHGMSDLSEEGVVYIDDYLDSNYVERIYVSPTTLVYTKPDYRDSVYNRLQAMPHARVYKKEALPERLHYGANSRIGDIVIIADCGWTLLRKGEQPLLKGAHGYDNACTDMDMIFYAYGPAFKQQYRHPFLSNTDLYNIVAHILGLTAAPNDGDFERVRGMLTPPNLPEGEALGR